MEVPMVRAKAILGELVDRAKRGEEVYITSRGKRQVRLVVVELPTRGVVSTAPVAAPVVAPVKPQDELSQKKARLSALNVAIEETQDPAEQARMGKEITQLRADIQRLSR